ISTAGSKRQTRSCWRFSNKNSTLSCRNTLRGSAMSEEPFRLDQLYRAVEQHLRTHLAGVQAVTAWPDIKDRVLLPAVFLEVAEIEPGTDIGTGETSLLCKFEARI